MEFHFQPFAVRFVGSYLSLSLEVVIHPYISHFFLDFIIMLFALIYGILLYNHDHYTYTYTYRNIFNPIRTGEDTSLEKNIPLTLFERVVCERVFETEQNCNILTPTLMAITAFLSRSPGLLNRGPGVPASLGHGPHSSIFSPTDYCSIGDREGPLCWVLVFSTASYRQLTRTSCSPSFIIVSRRFNSTCQQSRLFPWYLRPDAPVIYNGSKMYMICKHQSMKLNSSNIPLHY